MNEDLHPCYDIESDWKLIPSECRPGIQVFSHKDYNPLFRVVNFSKQSVVFTDEERLLPADIIDINKDIGMERKMELNSFLLRILLMEKPISMPYIHERLKAYIEDLGDYLGVLYFMDSDEEKTLVPIKRYFKLTKDPVVLNFQEISHPEYQEKRERYFEEEDSNVDKAQ